MKLLHFENLHPTDESFEPILDIIRKNSQQPIQNNPIIIESLVFGVFGGGGGQVYFISQEDAKLDNWHENGNPIQVESILIINEWIESELNTLKNHRPQLVRGTGFALLIVSYLYQLAV